MQKGVQDYLTKDSISGPVLSRVIRYAMERKRAETALREREERLNLAIAGADLGTWDWNVATGISTSMTAGSQCWGTAGTSWNRTSACGRVWCIGRSTPGHIRPGGPSSKPDPFV